MKKKTLSRSQLLLSTTRMQHIQTTLRIRDITKQWNSTHSSANPQKNTPHTIGRLHTIGCLKVRALKGLRNKKNPEVVFFWGGGKKIIDVCLFRNGGGIVTQLTSVGDSRGLCKDSQKTGGENAGL